MVNFLATDQAEVSTRYSTSGIDRFADGGWHPLPTGEPVISGAAGWIIGRIEARVPAGGSRLVVLEAAAARRPVPEKAGAPWHGATVQPRHP